jgi:hypothetical protein
LSVVLGSGVSLPCPAIWCPDELRAMAAAAAKDRVSDGAGREAMVSVSFAKGPESLPISASSIVSLGP